MWSRVSDRCQSKASGAWCNYNRQAAPCFLVAFVCVVIYPHICLNLSCQLQAAVVKAVSAQKRFMHAKLSISANYDKGTVQKGVKYFCNYIAGIHPDEGATPSADTPSYHPPPATLPSPPLSSEWTGQALYEKFQNLSEYREVLLDRYCNQSRPEFHITPFDCQGFLDVRSPIVHPPQHMCALYAATLMHVNFHALAPCFLTSLLRRTKVTRPRSRRCSDQK